MGRILKVNPLSISDNRCMEHEKTACTQAVSCEWAVVGANGSACMCSEADCGTQEKAESHIIRFIGYTRQLATVT